MDKKKNTNEMVKYETKISVYTKLQQKALEYYMSELYTKLINSKSINVNISYDEITAVMDSPAINDYILTAGTLRASYNSLVQAFADNFITTRMDYHLPILLSYNKNNNSGNAAIIPNGMLNGTYKMMITVAPIKSVAIAVYLKILNLNDSFEGLNSAAQNEAVLGYNDIMKRASDAVESNDGALV